MSLNDTLAVPYNVTHHERFDEEKFIKHASALFGSLDASGRRIRSGLFIPAPYKRQISSYNFIGSYKYNNSGSIDILTVKLMPGISADETAAAASGFLSSYIKKHGASGVLCAFSAPGEDKYIEMLAEAGGLTRLDPAGRTAEFMCLEALKNYIEKKSGLTRLAIDGFFSESMLLYDDILIARSARAIDSALAEMKFCDPSCGGGELILRMAETAADARGRLNKYLPVNHSVRSRDFHIKHFIERSMYAADSSESAPALLKALLKLRYPFASVPAGRIKWGSVILEDVFDGMLFDAVVSYPPHLRGGRVTPLKELLSGFRSNRFNADIYCYYVEKSVAMLTPDGSAVLLTSDRWNKAAYGEGLRDFFISHPPRLKVLLGRRNDITRSVMSMEAVSCFAEPQSSESSVIDARDIEPDGSISDFICGSAPKPEKSISGIEEYKPALREQLFNKIRRGSVKLADYADGRIYRGLLTGFNDAFVMDSKTSAKFSGRSSVSHLMPFYTGREVKRWALAPSKKRLIYFEKGFTNEHKDGRPSLEWFAENYGELAAYLAPYEERAEQRRDKGDYWWEMRSCRYKDVFQSDMIVLPGITKKLSAAYAPAGLYFNDKCSVIGVRDFFLLALLNSKLLDFVFRQDAPALLNEYYELRPSKLSSMPIFRVHGRNEALKKEIETDAQKLYEVYLSQPPQKYGRPDPDITALEKKIDASVFRLYGLSSEERALVENN